MAAADRAGRLAPEQVGRAERPGEAAQPPLAEREPWEVPRAAWPVIPQAGQPVELAPVELARAPRVEARRTGA